MKSIIKVKTEARAEMVDVTAEIQREVKKSGIQNGLGVAFVPHTTAGLTINEHADPDVARDLLETLGRLAPLSAAYRHTEGNADAHIKASLVGSSVTVLIENGKLVLGTWQGVFFCEFDGPRSRNLYVQIIKSD
jgi:secondary thiamine-phosphate synthase enzyme